MKKRLLIGLLAFVACFPLRMLYLLSDFIYFVIYYVVGYRKRVVRQNLTEAFPDKPAAEIKRIEKQYFHFMCDTIVETIKLLHISDGQMSRRVEVVNPEEVVRSVDDGKNVVLLMGHYGNWEWVQELSRYLVSKANLFTIYHPLTNQLWDEVYKKIRSRWHVKVVPQVHAVKALLNRDNQPWICGFIADARPVRNEDDAMIEFLNHYTSFIFGPEVIGRKVGADFFFLEMERVRRGYYRISFHKAPETTLADRGISYPVMRWFWNQFEAVIKKSPAYWLWSHKRWKRDRVLIN